jgi:serine/threonine-protein kinase
MVDQVIDAQSDVHSLGVVLWELLAGRSLFRAKSEVETLARIGTLVPPKISELRPELGDHCDAAWRALSARTASTSGRRSSPRARRRGAFTPRSPA